MRSSLPPSGAEGLIIVESTTIIEYPLRRDRSMIPLKTRHTITVQHESSIPTTPR